MITVLCVNDNTLYKKLTHKYDLDLWNKERNAFNYKGGNTVICHPPCEQWSARRRNHSKGDAANKNLAWFSLEMIHNDKGGILEHPKDSLFFKEAGIQPTLEIDQREFGFPIRKLTWLYFHRVQPHVYISQLFDNSVRTDMNKMSSAYRSRMTTSLCEWLIISAMNIKQQPFLA